MPPRQQSDYLLGVLGVDSLITDLETAAERLQATASVLVGRETLNTVLNPQSVREITRRQVLAYRNQEQATKPFNLLHLPFEIIMMIFKELGDLPRGPQAQISATNTGHPCYAICSTSKSLRDYYIATMGPLPTLELMLMPADYVVEGHRVSPKSLLDERLKKLGPVGIKHITKIWIHGPEIRRDTANREVARFLDEHHRAFRMAHETRRFLKRHVEEDICNKQAILNALFKNLLDVFGTEAIETLSIHAGELPAPVWKEVLVPYISSQLKLQSFHFTNADNSDNWNREDRRGLYANYWRPHSRLVSRHWFPVRASQPYNYPESVLVHKRNFELLNAVLTEFVATKSRVRRLRLSNNG